MVDTLGWAEPLLFYGGFDSGSGLAAEGASAGVGGTKNDPIFSRFPPRCAMHTAFLVTMHSLRPHQCWQIWRQREQVGQAQEKVGQANSLAHSKKLRAPKIALHVETVEKYMTTGEKYHSRSASRFSQPVIPQTVQDCVMTSETFSVSASCQLTSDQVYEPSIPPPSTHSCC